MSHNYGKKIGADFKNKSKKTVERAEVREFIYRNVLKNEISDLSKRSINFVLQRFHLCENDRIKIKKIIEVILKRDNSNLPPLLYQKHDFKNYMNHYAVPQFGRVQTLEYNVNNSRMELMPYK